MAKTKTKKTVTSALKKPRSITTGRTAFSVRTIRNANPRKFRSHKAGSVLSRIFSL